MGLVKAIKLIKTGVITVVLCLALTGLSRGNERYRYSGDNNIEESYRGSLRRPSVETDTEHMAIKEKIEYIAEQIGEGEVDATLLQTAINVSNELISYHEGKPEMKELDEMIIEEAEETVELMQGVIEGTAEEGEASESVWRLHGLVIFYDGATDTDDVSETYEEDSSQVEDIYGNIGGVLGRISEAIRNFLPSVIQPLFMRTGLYQLFQEYPDESSISLTDENREDYQNTLRDLETPDEVIGFFRGEYDDVPEVEYNNTLTNIVFGDPAGLFLNRQGNCHSFSRFAQEALEDMRDGTEPYETKLIHTTYDGYSNSHVMLAYRDPETGKWGFMDPYNNHSPEMIEKVGINTENPEAIVEFIGLMNNSEDADKIRDSETLSPYYGRIPGSDMGNPKRITFLDNSDWRVFNESYVIEEDGTYERENIIQRVFGYLFS